MNIIKTIETDLGTLWHGVEADAEKYGHILWADIRLILEAAKPALYAELRKIIAELLQAAESRDLPTLEAALLNVLSSTESDFLAEAQLIGSEVLQAIIAQVKAAVKA